MQGSTLDDEAIGGPTATPIGGVHAAMAFAAARWWPLAAAAALFAAPCLVRLATDVWSLEQGAHGPIILASGVWLLCHEARAVVPVRGTSGPIAIALPPLLVGYVLARMTGLLWLETLAVLLTLDVLLYAAIGGAAMRRLWFPLVYLLFVVPPPYALAAPFTHDRKLWLSQTATDLLSRAGYEVAYGGSTLYIDQYELLVADACAGMNSIYSLLAIGAFYIYLRHRADWRYAALLAVLVVPLALAANLVRVLLLILVTHRFGDAAAQGALHQGLGFTMFLVALVGLIGADAALTPLRRRLARR